ncbi:MAG: FAD-dependent monooxygenase, partial [Pseudomonadota bacterium]
MNEQEIEGTSDRPVLVVGAGPTGLVLAIELARRGVQVHLIDRLAEPAPWSAAIYIKARTLEIFAGMDLLDRFLALGQIVCRTRIFLGSEQVSAFDLEGLDTPYPYILSVPETDTIRLLTEKFESLAGTIDRGVEFVGLEEQGDRVRVHLKSEERGEYDLEVQFVVGTDGYHSAVRDAIGDEFDGEDCPQLWGVVDTALSGWSHPRDATCVQLEPPNVIPFPLGNDLWRLYFIAESAESADLATVGRRLALMSPGAALSNPGDVQFFRSHSRLARKFRIGRVFLAGDAAHATNPIEGHGMNAGIQDAYNLGWKLALLVSGTASEALLDSYEAERRAVDADMVDSGAAAGDRMAPGALEAREALIDFLASPEGPSLAAMASAEIAFKYDESPIVDEVGRAPSSPPATALGSRAGDVVGLIARDGEISFHDLIKGPSAGLFLMTGQPSGAGTDDWLPFV